MASYLLKIDSAGNYYWIIKSDNNGKTIAKSSEAYSSKQGARESIAWVRANAEKAGIRDEA